MTLPLRPPIIVNHMAALDKTYPPNSLEAIRACLESDAAFVEIDITALANDDYLLVHDPVHESETTGVGAVGKATVEQVRNLFIKTNNAPTLSRVAQLSEVVTLFLEYKMPTRLQLDYKDIVPFPD